MSQIMKEAQEKRGVNAEGEDEAERTSQRESPYVARMCHVALIEF